MPAISSSHGNHVARHPCVLRAITDTVATTIIPSTMSGQTHAWLVGMPAEPARSLSDVNDSQKPPSAIATFPPIAVTTTPRATPIVDGALDPAREVRAAIDDTGLPPLARVRRTRVPTPGAGSSQRTVAVDQCELLSSRYAREQPRVSPGHARAQAITMRLQAIRSDVGGPR